MGKDYTEAQKRATTKYLQDKTDLIRLRVPKGKKDEYMALAEKEGKSLTAYIIDTLAEKLGKEKGED